MSDEILAILQGFSEERVRNQIVRAPFGWPGGKSKSLDKILPHLPYRKKFVDVFGGSGIVTLNRKPSTLDVYNDRFSGVVAFYRCIRDKEKTDALIKRLELTVHSREEFYWCKETWENCEDDVERAARWYYMVQSSFAALGRDFGRATDSKIQSKVHSNLELFSSIHLRFKTIQVENLDFREIIKDYDSDETVFYCDPPYLDTHSSVYKIKFSRADHIELLNLIHESRGYFAVSGYPSDLYDKYEWDEKHSWGVLSTMRALAFTETNHQFEVNRDRRTETEVLWIKK